MTVRKLTAAPIQHRVAKADRSGEPAADCGSERKRTGSGVRGEAHDPRLQALRDERLANARCADAVQRRSAAGAKRKNAATTIRPTPTRWAIR
jgi:hypothetical protein